MRKIFYLFAIIASIALYGCHDDEDPIPEIPDKPDVPDVPEVDPDDGKLTLTIGVPEGLTNGGSKSRVSYQDASLSFTWDASDKVSVLSFKDSDYLGTQELSLKSGEGTAKGTFEITKVKDATRYVVYYKAANLSIQKDGTATVNYDGQLQESDASTAHLRNYFCLQSASMTADQFQSGKVDLKLANSIMRFQVKGMDAGLGKLESIEWVSNYGQDSARSMKLRLAEGVVKDHKFTGFLCFHPDSMQVAKGATTGLIFYGDNRYHVFGVDADGRDFTSGTSYDLIVSTEPEENALSNWECIQQDNAIWIATTDHVRPASVPEGFVLSEGLLMNKYWGLTAADGNAVTAVPAKAFAGLPITEVVLPSKVKEIGASAFEACTALKEIDLPASVETIGDKAFFGCSALERFSGKFATADGRALVQDHTLLFIAPARLTEYSLPSDVTTIAAYAFYGSKLVTVTLPNGLKEVGVQAFGKNPQLRTFIGKQVDSDGHCLILDNTLVAYAPAGMTSYTSSSRTSRIAAQVFAGCDQLTSISLNSWLTEVGDYAFEGCSKLSQVTINAGSRMKMGTDIFGSNKTLNVRLFLDYSWESYASTNRPTGNQWNGYTWKNIFIINEPQPEPVQTAPKDNEIWVKTLGAEVTPRVLDSRAEAAKNAKPANIAGFNEAQKVRGQEYWSYRKSDGNKITEIPAELFLNHVELVDIWLPETVTTIGACAFKGCINLKQITVPEGTKIINDGAFANCTSLPAITLPQGLQQYGVGVFEGCTALTKFDGSLASSDGKFLILKGELVDFISSIKGKVTVPANVTNIRNDLFASKTDLTEVLFPETLVTIGSGALKDCTGLTSVVIPQGVKTIGANAFNGCTHLTKLTVNAGYTTGITSDSFNGLTYANITVILNQSWISAGSGTAKPTQNSWLGFTWESISDTDMGGGSFDNIDPTIPGI